LHDWAGLRDDLLAFSADVLPGGVGRRESWWDFSRNEEAAMITRRSLIGLSALSAVVCTIAPVRAVNAKPRKIGWLKIQDKTHTPGWLHAFLEGLRTLGHSEGQSFMLETRFADGDARRLTQLAEELVRADVRIIIATSQPAVDASRRVTQQIPIVGRMTDDPVKAGIAHSIARPGGNVTGVYSLLEEMSGKRLALLQQAVPSLRRVGALLTLKRGATAHWLAEAEKAAQQLDLAIHVMDVNSANDLEVAFANAAERGVNGILAFRNPTVVTFGRSVIDLCNRYHMSSIFDDRDFAEAGGFMSYGPDLEAVFRRLASHADQILRGTKPSEIPIEQPTKFELVINLKTAKALGLTVPNSIQLLADEVIE
jgi:putative ABC transport system substrate-binding protein